MNPRLEIQLFNGDAKQFAKTFERPCLVTIGRENCDFYCGDDPHLSRHHCSVEWREGSAVFLTDRSMNGCYLPDDSRLYKGEPYRLRSGEPIRLGSSPYRLFFILPDSDGSAAVPPPFVARDPKSIVIKPQAPTPTHNFEIPTPPPIGSEHRINILGKEAENVKDNFAKLLKQKSQITIGRDKSNDIELKSGDVSRHHAEVIKISPTEVIVKDKDSVNGIFVDGKRIDGSAKLSAGQNFRIGFFNFSLENGVIDQQEHEQIAIQAVNISKSFKEKGKKKQVLYPLNFLIKKGEFVALMGPSGCGKSVLLQCLNGNLNPDKGGGFVKICGQPLDADHLPNIKQAIGYVPQQDIVHGDLTVEQTMFYAGKLRMGEEKTDAQIKERTRELFDSLNLKYDDRELMSTPVKKLSGGQRKRISIAVEMLNRPSILFLDEPTSPLDPETINEFLTSLQKLRKQVGITIIMVTHKPDDLEFTDRVLFISKGGYLCYDGLSNKMVDSFGRGNLIEVYSLFGNETTGKASGEKFYNQLKAKWKNTALPKEHQKLEMPRETLMIRQLMWLSRRYFQMKINNHMDLLMLAVQPLLIGILMVFVFDKLQIGVLFLMAVSAIWFGANNAAREIVDENDIYKRERMYNLNILTYMLSKIGVLALFGFGQVSLFFLIVYLKYRTPLPDEAVKLHSFLPNLGLLFVLTTSATLIGLLLSAAFKNAAQVLISVPLVLIPQIMLSGLLARLDGPFIESLSFGTLGRWGTESLCHVQDAAAKESKKPYHIEKVPNSNGSTTDEKRLAGVHYELPNPIRPNEFDLKTNSASKQLNLYCRKNAFKWWNSTKRNLLAIGILDLICFVAIFYFLKIKDPLR